MTDKPTILVHPSLGLFEMQLGAYDVVHWPIASEEIRAKVVAGITVGSIGLSNDMVDLLPNLKAIICFGAGVDGLDLPYLRARNVRISNGPNINHEDVADIAIGLMIGVARKFTEGARALWEEKWRPPLAVPPQRRLRGRKLGIVAMGAIGQAIAHRAEAFGLDVRWYGPRPKPDLKYLYEPDLKALATWADILVVAAPGGKATEKLISAEIIGALGEDGILINVARGSNVDEDALITALKAGKLGGAGLDVFDHEPTPPDRWRDVPNIMLTPHLGGGTREAIFAGGQNVLENLRRALADEELLTPLA